MPKVQLLASTRGLNIFPGVVKVGHTKRVWDSKISTKTTAEPLLYPPQPILRPHTRKGLQSQPRKAKIGRVVTGAPPWVEEFNEMKRSVSWATALESTADEKPPPFPPETPLQPPPPLPPRRGSLVSAVLALSESPSSPTSTSSEGKGVQGTAGVDGPQIEGERVMSP